MKIKMILVSMLAIAALTGCSKKDEGSGPPEINDTDVAYLSLKIETQNPVARSSEESGDPNESALKTLYLMLFDDAGNIVGIPGTSNYMIEITDASSKPKSVKVSAAATKLLVVANPGTKLKAVIQGINVTTTYTTVNAAIKDIARGEIVDDASPVTRGFTMINGGDETGKDAGDKIDDPLIKIGDKIQKITETVDEEAAKAAAEEDKNRVTIRIERLSSKVELKLKGDDNANIVVSPVGATFTFGNWTLDAVNGSFYPFAEKTLLSVTHTAGGSYTNTFYTRDPNFTDDVGIVKATINNTTFDPILVSPYTWKAAKATTYSTENTMAAAEQKFKNTTRVVVKGTYYPKGYASGTDWFNFAGENYDGLTKLQAAYNDVNAGPNFKAACEKMFDKIKEYAQKNSGVSLIGTTFATLKESDLLQVKNGGEVIKNGRNPVIRWYQKGLCYYYYEIRHDNVTTKEMDFGKYGVVRNNWYKLTLATVNGPGTPWYPSIDNPGPGDPDPEDPIDKSVGYLGIIVEVDPWIVWENEIGI